MEVYKEIAGFEGKYLVSNLGRVKSIVPYAGTHERILKQYLNPNTGYMFVCLANGKKIVNGTQRTAYKIRDVHRLVAETFLDNPASLPCVNHKDENKQNNSVDNLEWCTAKYNSNYGHCREKMSKKVGAFDPASGKLVQTFVSLSEAAQWVRGYPGNISSCCKGKIKTAYSYQWKYVDIF